MSMYPKSLSGRLLLLTTAFVMLAEIFIFVPSVARFREDFLLLKLEKAQIASLTLLADEMITPELEAELLENAGVYNVVLLRDSTRQLILSTDMPQPVDASFDLRDAPAFPLIRDALARIVNPEDEVIRVIGEPVRDAGLMIEVTTSTRMLRQGMVAYGLNILALSAVISLFVAGLLFWAIRGLMVTPVRNLASAMTHYSRAPEDARRIIQPSSDATELRDAEDALYSLQNDLTAALKQKDRLAQLGGAVAKISHDLRNILTTAQLFADRMEQSDDPMVARAAPKLVGSIGRAVNLCETTLKFGKAEEAPPSLTEVQLAPLADDIIEGERLALGESKVRLDHDITDDVFAVADPEHLHRVLSNLVRNARQALVATKVDGAVTLSAASSHDGVRIVVADTGPGLPPKAVEYLFTPFQGGTRKEGTGLGLAIASELIRGHGGSLELLSTGQAGTSFEIFLPQKKK